MFVKNAMTPLLIKWFNTVLTGRDGGSSGQAGASQGSEERNSQSTAAGTRQGFPTPEYLAEVMVSTRELLTEQAAEALLVCSLLVSTQLSDKYLLSNLHFYLFFS